VGLRIN